MKGYGRSAEVNKVIKAIEQQGWQCVQSTKTGHWMCYAPDGQTIVTGGGSASEKRALANFKSALRRAGATI
jgi:predicted RNA binding protein YcfA (HicA-like mRNA interferase family)